MPRWISDEGEWHPEKEKVALVDHKGNKKEGRSPGDPYIYEGPDRAALFELYKEGVEKFGQNFRQNTDFLSSIRTLGFQSIDEYLKAMGYDSATSKKEFESKIAKVTKHELPKKVEAVKVLGGGADLSGSKNNKYGGFGDQPEA